MSDRQLAKEHGTRQIRPLSTMCEEEGTITLCLEMPGVPKEGIELEVEGNDLRIRGRRPAPAGEPGAKYLVRERALGDFYEDFTLDETVDRNRIDAVMEGGVLTVTLHLREAEKPRRIQIAARQ